MPLSSRKGGDARRGLETWAGGLSIAAGGLHGGLASEHLQEWWGYGLFFLFAAAAQLVLGLALLTNAVNAIDSGPAWARLKRGMYGTGIAGNLAILGLYAVTRTVGIPVGAAAGRIEAVAPIDVVSKVLEAAVIVLLAVLLRRTGRAMTQSSSV